MLSIAKFAALVVQVDLHGRVLRTAKPRKQEISATAEAVGLLSVTPAQRIVFPFPQLDSPCPHVSATAATMTLMDC